MLRKGISFGRAFKIENRNCEELLTFFSLYSTPKFCEIFADSSEILHHLKVNSEVFLMLTLALPQLAIISTLHNFTKFSLVHQGLDLI